MSVSAQDAAGQDRGPVVYSITIALLVASSTFVILRLVSRVGIVKRLGWDDWAIVVAWVIAFGFSFSICWGVRDGLGHHEADIHPENEVALRKSEYVFSVLYNPALMATKTSILIFYLSLSKNQRVFRWGTCATLFVVNVAGLALTFLNIVQCHPVDAAFQRPLPSTAKCTNIVTLYLSSSPVNIITDLAILFLPMPILTSMRLPRKQKIILIVTFSFGAFVAAVDVVRIAYLQEAFQTLLQGIVGQNPEAGLLEQGDFSWYASLSFMWSAIEVHVGIICACVPALKPLVSKILPSMLRDTSDPNDVSAMAHELSDARPKTEILEPTSPTGARAARPPSLQGQEREFDMMEFMTTPNMRGPKTRTETVATMNTSGSTMGSGNIMDFYNMKSTKPMTKLTNKESIIPLALVTILFFLWGFAYGLLNILNSQFQAVVKITTGQALGLHAAYFGAYLFGPLTVGNFALKKSGFRTTFMTGLCIYACGTLIFWPSAVLASFPAFLVSNFIVGFGVSVIEVAANPFIALCGPQEYSEIRLNLSQGVQAIGTVVSPLLAKKVLFKSVSTGPSLIDAQWAYLGISLFDILLAVAFYYMPIPEASDDDFQEVAEMRGNISTKKLGNVPAIYITLAFGVASMWFYVGAQEGVATPFQDFIIAVSQNSQTAEVTPFDYQLIGYTVFAVGRFLCVAAQFIVRPRIILIILFTGMIVASSLAMVLNGPAGIAMILLCQAFESGIFPILFAMSLRGLGTNTKSGAVYLTAAISGGAIIPVVMDAIRKSRSMQYSLCTVTAASALGLLYPLYLTFYITARKQVDPVHEEYDERPLTPIEKAGRRFSAIMWRKKPLSDVASIEHVEGGKPKWPG